MKERLALLGCGIVLGVGFYHFTQPRPPIPDRVRVIKVADQRVVDIAVSATPARNVEIQTPKKATPEASEPVQETPETTYGIRVEESVVEELEAEKEILRQHAYSEPRKDGWKIHILEEDQALLHSGLSDGDLITRDSLNSQLQVRDRSVLVTRFVAVLQYIER